MLIPLVPATTHNFAGMRLVLLNPCVNDHPTRSKLSLDCNTALSPNVIVNIKVKQRAALACTHQITTNLVRGRPLALAMIKS